MNRFICVQMGARRGYVIPAILESAGLLDRFYTDICGDVGVGRIASPLRILPLVGPPLARLAGRRLPSSIRTKTCTFGGPVIRHALRRAGLAGDPATVFQEQLRFESEIGEAMIAEGYGSATQIYSMVGEGAPFIVEGRNRGLRVTSEVFIVLSADRILREERREHAGWEPNVPNFEPLWRESSSGRALLECTHRFVCPSDIVRDDLVANWGVAGSDTVVVPYGVNPAWLTSDPTPVRGRVLFVGSAILRKGIHYLAMAAEKLATRRRNYEFRVAGDVTEQVRGRSLCQSLTFLGRVPRDRIQAEFQQADIFVLPSLAEGSAEVTYEALAAGVPVITTRAAGSIVREGIEGRIITERDPDALADAIEDIVEDRTLRNRMALAARARARDYTHAGYSERLLLALTGSPLDAARTAPVVVRR